MTEDPPVLTGLTKRIKVALESADLAAIEELLDPDVRWGAPGDPAPGCQNRRQVLAWYRRGREGGVRATVTEIVAHGDKIVVGLNVVGRGTIGDERDGETQRWQVLTVAGDHIVDIRGFDDRELARAHAGSRR